jgi:midasin (ATPase involved in ribosome maturation)
VLDATATYTVNDMVTLLERVWNAMKQHNATTRGREEDAEDKEAEADEEEVQGELVLPHGEVEEIENLHKKYKALFAWYDGPLVQAMKRGDLFLIDEISLAEDSVLERLNR